MVRLERQDLAPGIVRAALIGRLDIGGCQEIDPAFNALATACRGLIVDLAQVDFIASIGLLLLIVAARAAARHGGRMVLLRPAPAVETVLVSSGADNVVPVLRNLDEAIRAVSG